VARHDAVTFVAAMRLEALALGGRVVRTGMGHRRATVVAGKLAKSLVPGSPVVLAGISGGLDTSLEPGEIVVATSVRNPHDEVRELSERDAAAAAALLRAAGHEVHLGPIASSKTLVHGDRRTELAACGALAVDMESSWVADALEGHRLVVVRIVADTAGNFVAGLVKGLMALRHVRPCVAGWPAVVAAGHDAGGHRP